MKKILKTDNILSISHKYCTDGSTCQILLSNVFNNITFRNATYFEIDNVLDTTNFDQYDRVFLTDISPSDVRYLDLSDKIVLLDHHGTAEEYSDPKKMRYVLTENSASKLTKNFLESYFNISLSYLNDLVHVVNDYDLWIHNNFKGRFLNELFFFYWETKFRKRFISGDTRFTEKEVKFLRKRKQQFIELYNSLTVHDLPRIKGCFFKENQFVNDLSDKLMNDEGYKIVFCQKPRLKNISVRSRIDEVHIGNVLKDLGIGGGHHDAGGINSMDIADVEKNLFKIEEIIYEKSESSRR